jgi:hypothetical protein
LRPQADSQALRALSIEALKIPNSDACQRCIRNQTRCADTLLKSFGETSARHLNLGRSRTIPIGSAYLAPNPFIQSFLRPSTLSVFRLAFFPNQSDECVVRCTQQRRTR